MKTTYEQQDLSALWERLPGIFLYVLGLTLIWTSYFWLDEPLTVIGCVVVLAALPLIRADVFCSLGLVLFAAYVALTALYPPLADWRDTWILYAAELCLLSPTVYRVCRSQSLKPVDWKE